MKTKRFKVTFSLKGASRYDNDAEAYVSYCPALSIYSQGESETESRKALKSAILLFLETCYQRNILDKVLKDQGFSLNQSQESIPTSQALDEYITIEEAKFDHVFDIDIPIHLVANAALRGSDHGGTYCS